MLTQQDEDATGQWVSSRLMSYDAELDEEASGDEKGRAKASVVLEITKLVSGAAVVKAKFRVSRKAVGEEEVIGGAQRKLPV